MKRKIRVKELRGIAREELAHKEKSLKEQLYKLNAERYTGRVEKPHMFSSLKREIAIIETILHETNSDKS
jgi:large subunit ribosomal protein L29